MTGFTDIHSHFIYGMDDGPKTRAEMEAMIDAAYADGITTLFATPHMTLGIRPFDFAVYNARLNEARQYCLAMGYGMRLHRGAEILYTSALSNYIADHSLPTLAKSRLVLIEFVQDISLREIEEALELMEKYGYVAMIAHIERYACLRRGNQVRKIKERYNVRCQVNASSILHPSGWLGEIAIKSWLKNRLISTVACDAHDCVRRPYRMKAVYRVLAEWYGEAYASWLTGIRDGRNAHRHRSQGE